MSISAAELEQRVRVKLSGARRVVVLGGWQVEREVGERVRKAKVRNKSLAWRKANDGRWQEYGRDYRAKNRGRVKAHDRAWRERNPEAYKAMRREANRRYYLKRKAARSTGT